MTGFEIFVVGSILACNAVLVGYLVMDKRRPKSTEKKDNGVAADISEQQSEVSVSETENRSLVGASSFDIDSLEARMMKVITDTVTETLPKVVKSMIGDVNFKDVEFAEETTDMPEPQTTQSPKFTPLSAAETDTAFDVDIRDVEDSVPSAPTATGIPLDELEEKINTAMNPDATPEQQAEAGKILSDLRDTELMERLTSTNDDIDRRVNLCIRMSIQAEIREKNSVAGLPRPVKKVSEIKTVTVKPEDFNPADMLP